MAVRKTSLLDWHWLSALLVVLSFILSLLGLIIGLHLRLLRICIARDTLSTCRARNKCVALGTGNRVAHLGSKRDWASSGAGRLELKRSGACWEGAMNDTRKRYRL
ncbi:uncharacterized protein P884DRAFT_257103, partial [Thermothelomyces heterothallicus CBS 202.75]|uniref:uncharacterized protein n=1 Tax=Thermothelomyces heterothallicus CBS 202.75 TaxID=1149848 RepID=UPI0037420268